MNGKIVKTKNGTVLRIEYPSKDKNQCNCPMCIVGRKIAKNIFEKRSKNAFTK